jgi:hypothetical protein
MKRYLLAGFLTCILLVFSAQVAGVDGSIIFPLRVLTGDGTAASPSHSFFNDRNTGLYRSGADSLCFVTGGVSRWCVNSSGHVVPTTGSTYNIGNGVNEVSWRVSRDASGNYRGDFLTANNLYVGRGAATGIGHIFSNATAMTGGRIAEFDNDFVGTTKASIDFAGGLRMAYTDMSGTPGDVTINTPCGRVAVATGTNVVAVTNSLVTATTVIVGQLAENDATCQSVRYIDPNSGNFEILVNANCAADTNFDFCIYNAP